MPKDRIHKNLIQLYGDFKIKRLKGPKEDFLSSHALKPHRHDYFQIIWIRKGAGSHLLEQEIYPIKDRCLYLILPHQVHHLRCEGDIDGYLIDFSDIFLESVQYKTGLLCRLPVHTYLRIPESEASLFSEECGLLYRYFTGKDFFGKPKVMQSYLQILLTKIENFRQKESNQKNDFSRQNYDLLERFIDLVGTYCVEQKYLPFYTSELGVSTRKLYNAVKEMTGFSPAQFIEKYVLNEAARMLQFTPHSVKEIAGELGYADDSYFVKAFKKHYRQTPAQFRISYQEANNRS
ncbi:AraC family transcriptional regulator (plasmid) [Fulvitalea axinellae]|uniref:AraC family transcriptional regulator n=1 Tax=Fulvitalea axinellae TaxID=1182444 RepID=A0AAU9CXC6_9BACT|nr:AraC family transcriptional regulator [Fulvitalea axinellae]